MIRKSQTGVFGISTKATSRNYNDEIQKAKG